MWAVVKLFAGRALKAIPWKIIVAGALLAGVFFSVRLVVNTIDSQAKALSAMTVERNRLKGDNNILELQLKTNVAALEMTIKENQERTRDYEESFKKIEAQPDGDACINSPAIIESLRLRRERRDRLRSQPGE